MALLDPRACAKSQLERSRSRSSLTKRGKKMAEVLLGGKRLNELKVTELKAELDKRGLPKKGVKSVLVQRLKNAILKEALTQVSISFYALQ